MPRVIYPTPHTAGAYRLVTLRRMAGYAIRHEPSRRYAVTVERQGHTVPALYPLAGALRTMQDLARDDR